MFNLADVVNKSFFQNAPGHNKANERHSSPKEGIYGPALLTGVIAQQLK